MMTNSGTLEQQLEVYEQILSTAHRPHILGLLKMSGMDSGYLAERDQLLKEIMEIEQKREDDQLEKYAITNKLKVAVKGVERDLTTTVKSIKQQGGALAPYHKRLGIDQDLPTEQADQISFAVAFYAELFSDAELLKKVCRGSLTRATLEAQHNKVKDLRKQETKRVELEAEMNQDRMDANIKMGILDELMDEFKVKAKKALASKPDYLAELGLSGGAYQLSA